VEESVDNLEDLTPMPQDFIQTTANQTTVCTQAELPHTLGTWIKKCGALAPWLYIHASTRGKL